MWDQCPGTVGACTRPQMGSDGAFGDGYGVGRPVRTAKPHSEERGVVTGLNQTPTYWLRGGKVVEAEWKGWMGRVCNWTETRFSVMAHSLGLHRIEARSY